MSDVAVYLSIAAYVFGGGLLCCWLGIGLSRFFDALAEKATVKSRSTSPQRDAEGVFSSTRRMWNEARGTVLLRQSRDIIGRFAAYGSQDRTKLIYAFEDSLDEVERRFGCIDGISDEKRLLLSGRLFSSAKSMFAVNPSGCNGGALLAIYLEASSTPGNDAVTATSEIREWHRLVCFNRADRARCS